MKPALVDNMILSYLAQAMATGYDPATDDAALAEQRIASLRLFFWTDLAVGPTAIEQSQRAKDAVVREELDRLVGLLLDELEPPDESLSALTQRTRELADLHGDEEDCRIVAEAELAGVRTLLTFDKALAQRLKTATNVEILTPAEHWARLAIPHGTAPLREPALTNPLRDEAFWRWD